MMKKEQPAPFSEMVEIPKDVIESTTIQGYFRVFYRILGDYDSQIAAYEALESQREKYGLPRRYATMHQLRCARSRLMSTGWHFVYK